MLAVSNWPVRSAKCTSSGDELSLVFLVQNTRYLGALETLVNLVESGDSRMARSSMGGAIMATTLGLGSPRLTALVPIAWEDPGDPSLAPSVPRPMLSQSRGANGIRQ